MDNLTHSLLGLALAEVAYQFVRRRYRDKKSPPSRRPYFYGAVIASNFPDLDLIMRVFDSSPLAYLVHHRGWTHTLFATPPQALLVFLLISWRQKHKAVLLALCCAGVLSHMLLDYQNSYGIHMFSPFDHHWMYGDTLFIVEPTLWIPVLALGFLTWPSKILNGVLLLCFFSVQGMGYNLGLLTIASLCILSALLIANFLVLRELKPFHRALLTIVLLVSVIGVFRIHKSFAQKDIAAELQRQNVGPLIDLVLSPMPTHPTCWSFLAVSLKNDDYRVDAGVHGHNCPIWNKNQLDLPKSPLTPVADFNWLGTYRNSAQHIKQDFATDCRVQTFFQFVRVPARDNNVLSDLRFGGNRSFSALFLNEKVNCPKYPTPWIPPRQDLLNAQ